ncbi:LysR family transcriptional regulator [Photobacterium aquimaris]|uniref:LysR family transcriptional regulator n=1 Tax=Photobacterium aquimaris TaxID=512643 RepID=A0A2T3IHF3_9GAMM|nr:MULTISPECIES: LysR family transcriptional regulator [Photobacterium]OBU15946.1 LysR family transcriptional regulator [Photobacterium aquimaris]OBU20433.1 LysR family transcriptional regulator [Photobacterium aquimaris]PSU27075.1 LysR family transcriptional regulator [Photobacterium aquimaris]PSV98548.1 LysR family transcriptional regulator [Photobacterium aquimaris]
MDTRLLIYFTQLAQTKNFTRAAEQLHIAQPALSVAIKKLEQQLDLTLFYRNERKVSLTQEGEVLLIHAKQILQKIDDATLAMKELRGLEKGEVRLGVPSMLGSYFFPQILMGFKSHYPNLKLTIVEAGTQSIRQMLVEGELDLGVIINHNVPSSLQIEHLLRSQMVAVVSEHHEFATKKSLSFDDFFGQELVAFKPGYFHREILDHICEQHHLTANISFETNLLPMILQIIRHDFAITSLLELVTDHESNVIPIPFAKPIHLDLAMAWRKQGYLSLADRTFIEYVKQQCQQ